MTLLFHVLQLLDTKYEYKTYKKELKERLNQINELRTEFTKFQKTLNIKWPKMLLEGKKKNTVDQ